MGVEEELNRISRKMAHMRAGGKEPTMTAVELEALCRLQYDGPHSIIQGRMLDVLLDLTNAESRRHGYKNWLDALDNIGPVADEERAKQREEL